MLKLVSAAAVALVLASPAFAQVTRVMETTTTTTTQIAPSGPAIPPPADISVAPLSAPDSQGLPQASDTSALPQDNNGGPGDQPRNLGTLDQKIVHPGTVTTKGESTTVTVPPHPVGSATTRESTRFGIDVP